jgi:hypothetical protein
MMALIICDSSYILQTQQDSSEPIVMIGFPVGERK